MIWPTIYNLALADIVRTNAAQMGFKIPCTAGTHRDCPPLADLGVGGGNIKLSFLYKAHFLLCSTPRHVSYVTRAEWLFTY